MLEWPEQEGREGSTPEDIDPEKVDPDAVSEKRNTVVQIELVHVEKGEKILRRSISPLDLRAMVMCEQ